MTGNDDGLITAVAVAHLSEEVNYRMEHDQVRPHGHGAGENHVIAFASGNRRHDLGNVSPDHADGLAGGRLKIAAPCDFANFAARIELLIGQGKIDYHC